jgi:hypothetical protein
MIRNLFDNVSGAENEASDVEYDGFRIVRICTHYDLDDGAPWCPLGNFPDEGQAWGAMCAACVARRKAAQTTTTEGASHED